MRFELFLLGMNHRIINILSIGREFWCYSSLIYKM